jgi:hypothetical protein
MLWIREEHHLPTKLPVHEILRRVAGHIAPLGIVPFCAIFSKPVEFPLPMEDAPAMCLYRLAAIIEPDLTRAYK